MMEKINQYKEIYEAVQSHPFFHGVEIGTALSLLKDCEKRNYEKNEIILHKDKEREGLVLILEGIAEVFVTNSDNQEEVLEVVQKGELIGFSSLADFLGVPRTSKEEMVEVRAVNRLVSLFIPFEVMASRWEDPLVRDYLLTQIATRLRDVYGSLAEQVKLARNFGESEAFMIRVQDLMTERVVSVYPTTSIMDAAKKMNEERTSSVLVVDRGSLKGIITERDMVARVVAKGVPIEASVQEVMTKNPVTISRFAYYYEAISLILLQGIKHLPVVENGQLLGIVTLSDLFRKKSENVMKAIKQISEAKPSNLANIKQAIYTLLDALLKENIPILKTLEIITKLYDRLVVRIIELAVESVGKPPSPFAFYQMGSSGRGEQFMLTDQDHFLVYEREESGYFEALGKKITSLMEAAGYERCKGLMMCSEKAWRGNLSDWEDRLRKWSLQSTNENLLLAQNFFSYRFITGSEELNTRFSRLIVDSLHRSKIFLYRLAQLEREHPIPSLEHPIRSLFRLEKKSIDMKKSLLFPYHHSLQILALAHEIPSGTPIEKMDALFDKGVISEAFLHELKETANQLLTLYVKQRWEKSSSVINFPSLTSREKNELILGVKTLKELQGLVFGHFSV